MFIYLYAINIISFYRQLINLLLYDFIKDPFWGTWVAQWLNVCLQLKVWFQGPGIESHPHQAPCMEPATPSAYVSASLYVSLVNE